MNLDELRAVQDREREKDSLQHLRDSFYAEVGRYIGDLRAERERQAERAEDPFADAEVRRLTDEIETAEEVAESIYERRMGKVVKTASLAAAGYRAETEGLTEEEADLFDDLVDRIEDNQATVLDVLAGDGRLDRPGDATPANGAGSGSPGAPTDRGGSDAGGSAGEGTSRDEPSRDASASSDASAESDPREEADGDDGDRPAAEAIAATAPDDEGAAGESDGSSAAGDDAAGGGGGGDDGALATDAAAAMGDPERVTVRITADVGEIVGIDGTAYDLAADDVVTLPEENAMPLVEKDAATRID